jgi:hypothetical protein
MLKKLVLALAFISICGCEGIRPSQELGTDYGVYEKHGGLVISAADPKVVIKGEVADVTWRAVVKSKLTLPRKILCVCVIKDKEYHVMVTSQMEQILNPGEEKVFSRTIQVTTLEAVKIKSWSYEAMTML